MYRQGSGELSFEQRTLLTIIARVDKIRHKVVTESLIHLVQLPDESGKSSELRVGISLEALTSVFPYEDKKYG